MNMTILRLAGPFLVPRPARARETVDWLTPIADAKSLWLIPDRDR